MSTLLLDTNIVSYLMRGHSLAAGYQPYLDGQVLAISFMTVAEMHEGALRANWGERKRARLASVLRSYLAIPSSPEICERWGEVRFTRRQQPISGEDAWIAATALAYDISLVTHNRSDFEDIPGLKLVSLNAV